MLSFLKLSLRYIGYFIMSTILAIATYTLVFLSLEYGFRIADQARISEISRWAAESVLVVSILYFYLVRERVWAA